MRGIDENRIKRENGTADGVTAYLALYLLDADEPTVNNPASVRIEAVRPGDVVAIHDLANWRPNDVGDPLWRPTIEQVVAARKTAEEWLGCFS